jgi:hypothetical protein
MSQLFAFLNAEEIKALETSGHYDAEQQTWVGDELSLASGSSGGGGTYGMTSTAGPNNAGDSDWGRDTWF